MNSAIKTKLKFVTTLRTRHSKEGNRSICNRLAMEHFDKLTCRPEDNVLYVGCGTGDEAVILATKVKTVLGEYLCVKKKVSTPVLTIDQVFG